MLGRFLCTLIVLSTTWKLISSKCCKVEGREYRCNTTDNGTIPVKDKNNKLCWDVGPSKEWPDILVVQNTPIKKIYTDYFYNFVMSAFVNCSLGNITAELFSSNLTTIDVSGNNIRSIQPSTFKGLNLEFLNLRRNNLSTLDSNVFKSTIDLAQLDLSRNHIREIPKSLFSTMSKLEVLKLSHNKIVYISLEHFKQLALLRELYLDHNKIKEIKNTTFSYNVNLKILSLANNSIKTLDKYTFSTLIYLKQLDLSNNELKVAHKEWFNYVRDNSYLKCFHPHNSLAGNEFDCCNSQMGPLKDMLNNLTYPNDCKSDKHSIQCSKNSMVHCKGEITSEYSQSPDPNYIFSFSEPKTIFYIIVVVAVIMLAVLLFIHIRTRSRNMKRGSPQNVAFNASDSFESFDSDHNFPPDPPERNSSNINQTQITTTHLYQNDNIYTNTTPPKRPHKSNEVIRKQRSISTECLSDSFPTGIPPDPPAFLPPQPIPEEPIPEGETKPMIHSGEEPLEYHADAFISGDFRSSTSNILNYSHVSTRLMASQTALGLQEQQIYAPMRNLPSDQQKRRTRSEPRLNIVISINHGTLDNI